MLPDDKLDRLKELTSRAISVNRKLLSEEERFVEAVSGRQETEVIKAINDEIVELNRTETLYIQAVTNILASETHKE